VCSLSNPLLTSLGGLECELGFHGKGTHRSHTAHAGMHPLVGAIGLFYLQLRPLEEFTFGLG
jgi:hypothetical protein